MTTGTKSVLFGVHQFALHPMTVLAAWVWLYRSFPSWRELFCIVIHDLGYWGKANMDDAEGERHVEWAARVAGRLFGAEYRDLCLFHSRHYARTANREPSRLCWPDKLSVACEAWWTYLPRAWASGELHEYRQNAENYGGVPMTATHREWFAWVKARLVQIGIERRGDAVPYAYAAAETAATAGKENGAS